MATFYKYAERSAESQVNWAEIGKDMTDMLRQEVAVREEKKAAIDEATRKLSQEVANAPQGESVSAKEEAIRLADQVTKYMLQQEKLLKSGLLDPKDYMVSRQNLTDGTRQAYQTMKDFQAKYGELMEGVRKGTTSIISVKELEKIQGYGNFRQSGFFIDSPTGKLNVGLKEEQTINGQKVIGLKPGSTVGMQYIQGGIYGVRDVYDYRKDIMELSNSLGEEIRVTLDPATMSKLGTAKTLSDLRQRAIKIATEDPTQEKEIFNYLDSMEKAIDGYLVNENSLSSLLADTMGYDWTDDPELAKKNPKTILGGVDPNTGQPNVSVTDEANQAAKDFMMQQFLGTIDVKESVEGMGFVPQPRAQTEAEIGRDERKRDAENFGKNLGTALKSTDPEERNNAINYLAQKAGRQVQISGGKIMVYDLDGQGKSEFNLNADPDKLASSLISAFGVDLPEDTILKFASSTLKGNRTNVSGDATGIISEPPPSRTQVVIPLSAIGMSSTEAAASIQEALPANFTAEDLTPGRFEGNQVKITAPNKKTFTINTKLKGDAAVTAKKELQDFIKLNNVAVEPAAQGAAAAGTGNLNASNRKP